MKRIQKSVLRFEWPFNKNEYALMPLVLSIFHQGFMLLSITIQLADWLKMMTHCWCNLIIVWDNVYNTVNNFSSCHSNRTSVTSSILPKAIAEIIIADFTMIFLIDEKLHFHKGVK